jgi:hypothetical protein
MGWMIRTHSHRTPHSRLNNKGFRSAWPEVQISLIRAVCQHVKLGAVFDQKTSPLRHLFAPPLPPACLLPNGIFDPGNFFSSHLSIPNYIIDSLLSNANTCVLYCMLWLYIYSVYTAARNLLPHEDIQFLMLLLLRGKMNEFMP